MQLIVKIKFICAFSRKFPIAIKKFRNKLMPLKFRLRHKILYYGVFNILCRITSINLHIFHKNEIFLLTTCRFPCII